MKKLTLNEWRKASADDLTHDMKVKIRRGRFAGKTGIIHDFQLTDSGELVDDQIDVLVDVPKRPFAYLGIDDILIENNMKKKSLKEGIGTWGIATPKPISLGKLAKEAWEPTKQEAPKLSIEDKKKFMETIANFSKLSDSIYREQSLQDITEQIKYIVDSASQVTVTETEDWFDRVTVQRHMKQLGESYKTFEKTAKQIAELQQRLEACYEDIGTGLNRYYNINPSVTEGADYQRFFADAMKKFNVKSPADFKDEKKKQDFFNWVDKNYVAKNEK